MFPEGLLPRTEVLNEERLRKAVLSGWKETTAYLDQFEFDEQLARDVALTLRRTTRLVNKRPHDTIRRDELLDNLIAYAAKRIGASPQPIIDAISILKFAESGYYGILAQFAESDAARLAPDVRISLALKDCAKTFHAISEAHHEAVLSSDIVGHTGVALDELGDAAIVGDNLNDVIVAATTSIVLMTCLSANWVDAEGHITISGLVETSDADADAIEGDQILASNWNRWRLLEERLRYLGGERVLWRHEDFDAAEVLHHESFYAADMYIHLANERLRAKFFNNVQLIKNAGLIQLDDPAGSALPPKAFISFPEAASLQILNEVFSIDFANDETRYGKLRVVEWLRAYAVLQHVARDSHSDAGVDGLLKTFRRGTIVESLRAGGLSNVAATAAVEHFTFRKDTVDLFDTPLIDVGNDQLLAFGPGLISTSPVLVLMSIFRSKGYNFERKGAFFEQAVESVFRTHKVTAIRVHEVVDNQEYECEVVCSWDGRLYAIECKSRLLPGVSPAQMYYFWRQLDEDIGQVKRFAAFLENNAELRERYFGPGAGENGIIPCIAYSSLFWCAPINDVLFCDISMLRRFFEEKYIFLSKPVESEGIRLIHRVAIDANWSGNAPVATDFQRYVTDPPQIRGLLPTFTLVNIPFTVGEYMAMLPCFVPRKATLAEILSGFPVTEETIRDEFDKVERALKNALSIDDEAPPAVVPEADQPGASSYRLSIFSKDDYELQ